MDRRIRNMNPRFRVIYIGLLAVKICACEKYGPIKSVLEGQLVPATYPGPPEYEDTSKGDSAEHPWILQLRAPICIDPKLNDDLNIGIQSINKIQLAPNKRLQQKLKELKGKPIKVTGTLFHAHTVHYRTEAVLLLEKVTISLNDE